MPAEVIELLDTTDEEADAAEASSDDFKLRNLRTLCGPRPAASVLKNLLSNARGDVQQAANAFFASSDEDPREEASVVIVGAHDGGAQMSTEEELAGEPQADDDQSRPELVLKVGDTVVLSGSANNRSLREGPLRPGVPGTVQTVDRTEESDEEPYQVKAKNGVTWWYSTTDLEKVSSPAPSRAPVKAAGADSDPDVVVESAESRAAKRRAVASASGFAAVDDGGGGGGGDGDDDVVMTGVDDPTMEFAHARFNCRRPGFSFGNSREQNKKACSNCFCFVCDVEASKCQNWTDHCMAFDEGPGSEVWTAARRQRKAASPAELARIKRQDEISQSQDPLVRMLPKALEPTEDTPPMGYRRAKAAVGVRSLAREESWPRLIGTLEMLLPRCVMHTHSTVPHNAKIDEYFSTKSERGLRRSGVPLRQHDGSFKMDEKIMEHLQSLQTQGFLQISWDITHKTDRLEAAQTKKLQTLAKLRPMTFDLTRLFVPNSQYRSLDKTYEHRPAQAEGNETWWSCACELKCLGRVPEHQKAYYDRRHAGVPRLEFPPKGADRELQAALNKLDKGPHTPDNCCVLKATISFEKRIAENSSGSGDSRVAIVDEVRYLMSRINMLPFPAEQLVKSDQIDSAQPQPTVAQLTKRGDDALAAKDFTTAIDAYTAALNLPLRQRTIGSDADRAREALVLGRARARLRRKQLDTSMRDCAILLRSKPLKRSAPEVLYVAGLVLMEQKKYLDARAYFSKALSRQKEEAKEIERGGVESASSDTATGAAVREKYKRAMAEAQAAIRALADEVPAGTKATITIHNCLSASDSSMAASDDKRGRVDLYCEIDGHPAPTITKDEQGVSPWRQFHDTSAVTVQYEKEYVAAHQAASYHRSLQAAAYITTSDPVNDLGIIFGVDDTKTGKNTSESKPPVVIKSLVAPKRSAEPRSHHATANERQNKKLAPGLVLSEIKSFSHQTKDTDRRYGSSNVFDCSGKSLKQILDYITKHKRPIAFTFHRPNDQSAKYLGTFDALRRTTYGTKKNIYATVALNCVTGQRLFAVEAGQGVQSSRRIFETTVDSIETDACVHKNQEKSQDALMKKTWKKAKQHVLKSDAIDTFQGLNATQAQVVQTHISRWEKIFHKMKNAGTYQNLKTLQDSPLFGLSENYEVDGFAQQLDQSPPQLNVTLRNYQMQAVRWMLDRENMPSISDTFWCSLPMGVSSHRRGGTAPTTDEAQLYYCAAAGLLSVEPPEKSRGGILAEEMGLGKTIEVLALLGLTIDKTRKWMQEAAVPAAVSVPSSAIVVAGAASSSTHRPAKPRGGTLIVCPVTLFGQWRQEIRNKMEEGHELSVYEYHTGRSFRTQDIVGHDIVLTTFSIMNREETGIKRKDQPDLVSPLKQIEWYRVVLDEVHSIKQPSTKQALYCMSLVTERRWAVTGTVMQTKMDDIAGPLQFLRLAPFGSPYFYNRYLGQRLDASKVGWRARRRNNVEMPDALHLLSQLMRDVTMRHTKTQMFQGKQILELPPRTQGVIMLEMSAREKAIHDELQKQARTAFEAIPAAQLPSMTLKLMSLLLPLRMLASNPSSLAYDALPDQNSGDGENSAKTLTKAELTKKLAAKGADQARIDATMKELSSGADDGLQCSICLDVVDGPACTPCGHVFCLECINMVVKGAAGTGTKGPCPSCRAEVKDDELYQLKPEVDPNAKVEPNPLQPLLQASQTGIGTKIAALMESLSTMQPGQKAVVFTQFSKTHTAMVKAMHNHGVGVVQIHGAMAQKSRSKALERFLTDDKISVFALSLRSGAVGLTLTRASRCYLMEPCLNEGTELQAVNRIHRLGQTRKVSIATFVMKGTVEERLLQLRAERAKAQVDSAAKETKDEREAAAAAEAAAKKKAEEAAQLAAMSKQQRRRHAQAQQQAEPGNAPMSNFAAQRERLVGNISEYQLMFGCRAATEAADLGDPLLVDTATANGDEDDDEAWQDDGSAASVSAAASSSRKKGRLVLSRKNKAPPRPSEAVEAPDEPQSKRPRQDPADQSMAGAADSGAAAGTSSTSRRSGRARTQRNYADMDL